MAFLWKHPQSKYFIARFTDFHGKRRNRSTRSTNRKQAQKIAEEYELAANKKRTMRQVRETISALHEEITGEELSETPFREYSVLWLEEKKPEVAPSTLAYYRSALNKFIVFLGAKADADIASILSDDVMKFRNFESKTLAPKTVNHDLKVLRMLFRSARRQKAIVDDPSEFVSSTKKAIATRRRPFTIPELKAVIAVADEEWRSLIRFGLYTGQRLGDLASLTWTNVDLRRKELRLITRKTRKSLILPIEAPLLAQLRRLPKSNDPDAPLHPRAFRILKAHGVVGNLSNQFADLLAQAGLREKKAHRKTGDAGVGRGIRSGVVELSFHCLRHTAVSLMKDAGIPSSVVMDFVGHDSEQMSTHYTHVGMESLSKAAASLPTI